MLSVLVSTETAWAQAPWERAANNLAVTFTGPLARSLVLVAIVASCSCSAKPVPNDTFPAAMAQARVLSETTGETEHVYTEARYGVLALTDSIMNS